MTFNSLYPMCTVRSGSVLQYVFWLFFPPYWNVSVFPLFLWQTHPFPTHGKAVIDFYFCKGDYVTEQIYSLSYQEQLLNSGCVIKQPGVNLIVVIMFAAANLRYVCISPRQWSSLRSLCFLLSFLEDSLEFWELYFHYLISLIEKDCDLFWEFCLT